MKKYIKCIPLTAFATALVMGGSLSAAERTSDGNSAQGQQTTRTTITTTDDQVTTDANVIMDRNVFSDKNPSPHAKASADRKSSTGKNASASARANSQPMTASSVLGMNIDNGANDKIGEIDEIFIDSTSGKVIALVVSTGGFLGMGQNQTLISPQDLRFNNDRSRMHADLSKDQIKNAPRYKKGETVALQQVRALGKTDRSNRADRADASNRLDVQAHHRGLALSDLIGMSVENRQGDTIGRVDEVFLDHDNSEVAGVVVSTGGFLGMGDRKTLFGLQEMTFDHTNEKVYLDYNREQVGKFPEYKANEQSDFAGLRDRMNRLTPRSNRAQAGDSMRSEARGGKRSSEQTVFDQGNSSEEIAMTASIRTAIRDDKSLSSRANNVTIITKDGKVLIRGEVDSAAEKTAVEGIAHSKAGRQNVTSEVTVSGRRTGSQATNN